MADPRSGFPQARAHILGHSAPVLPVKRVSTKYIPEKIKNWICYGKRTGREAKSISSDGTPQTSLDSEIQMTKMLYDQQNMIKCFEERNFYRLLFVFFQSIISPLGKNFEVNQKAKSLALESAIQKTDKSATLRHSTSCRPAKRVPAATKRDTRPISFAVVSVLQQPTKWASDFSENHWNAEYTRWRSKKIILFARSELKRLFRKVLFMKSESLLFSQIFLIPLAAFFGILYTFWTFSVSSTVTTKQYVPIAQQKQILKSPQRGVDGTMSPRSGLQTGSSINPLRGVDPFRGFKSAKNILLSLPTANINSRPISQFLGQPTGTRDTGLQTRRAGYSSQLAGAPHEVGTVSSPPSAPLKTLKQPSRPHFVGFQDRTSWGSSWVPKWAHNVISDLKAHFANGSLQFPMKWAITRFTGPSSSREIFFSSEERSQFDELDSPVGLTPEDSEDLIEFEEEQAMKFTPFFTSYKVDWSPTRGFADFLRFTNLASKIFILWASLTVFRSLRPVKANRPELQIQTRFLRPFQNRKRFRDLEGIEKFSDVLTTLTESLQGSFKDPLFYLALILPNLPFFQPFQKAIGKFRFFLFYGKQTAFLRKTINVCMTLLLPQEKQKQAQSFPKGYLFIGPPGTGKTLLAQAIAGESKVNFICLSASEIQKQVDIGTRIGALRLRNLFEEARTSTPCILFFDEIDTLGRARLETAHEMGSPLRHPSRPHFVRSAGVQPDTRFTSSSKNLRRSKGGSNRRGSEFGMQPAKMSSFSAANKIGPEIDLKLFTEFLVQMDSFSVKDGFLVIGTTNFLSSLDPAFVRSGRFDRILGLNYPPKKTRIAILKLHIQKKGNFFDSEIPWNIFGLKTKDLSPADLAKIVNESSLYLLNQLNELSPGNFGHNNRPTSLAAQTVTAFQQTTGATKWPLVKHKLVDQKSETHFMGSCPLRGQHYLNFVFNNVGFIINLMKSVLIFKPGLTHTSKSLREGFVKISESKK
jgi:DNA polymerase III delta prime subunit